MGLQLEISASEETNSIIINNCTGLLSSENPGGFGGQIRFEDIESAVIEVTPPFDQNPFLDISQPDPQPPLPDSFIPPTFTIDVFPDFPNQEGNGYEILPYMVGQSDNFLESGKWSFKLIITGTDKNKKKFKKTAIAEEVFVNSVTCCVDKLQPQVSVNGSKDKKQQAINEMSNLLESMCYAKRCGLLDRAEGIIRLLKAQCKCCAC